MMVLVTFVGWIVVRYAGSYLDGEVYQGPFLGWIAATLSAVLHAGAVPTGGGIRLLVADGRPHLDVEGLFAWLATDEDADGPTRDRARALVALTRRARG